MRISTAAVPDDRPTRSERVPVRTILVAIGLVTIASGLLTRVLIDPDSQANYFVHVALTASNLLILAFAEQTNRACYRNGGPFEASLDNIPADVELRLQDLPSDQEWDAAKAPHPPPIDSG